ncbi:MAG: hypothetical protein ABI614_09590 [Planctomycetota bacterium]
MKRVVVTTFDSALGESVDSMDGHVSSTVFSQPGRHAYWALVESYRSAAGPRQRVVAWLGKLDEAGRLGVEQAARDASSRDSLYNNRSEGLAHCRR